MKNRKPIIFAALLFVICLTVGGTIAYYTSSDTFENTFNSGTYDIETQENFVSPDNWTPGTTTPKTVIATNKGTTPAAVRIKLTPSWVDANGDPLPLKDGNNNDAAIINFSNNYDRKWIYQDGYYYYKRALNENQSTTSLLKSVTFNPNFEIDKTENCTTSDGLTTCRTTYNDYSGGTYTLQVEIETCQYDQYQEIWNTNVSLNDPILVDGTLMVQYNSQTSTFGKVMSRERFESITIVDNKIIPDTAIDSWDVSAEQNGSVMAWYLDADNDNRYELYIGQDDGVKANPDSSFAFANYKRASTFDLTNLDTSSVTNMQHMFSYVGYNLDSNESFNMIGLNNWDTSGVTTMNSMFYYAGYMTSTFNITGLNNWDTSNVTNFNNMFSCSGYYATSFNLDLSNWNTSKVNDMSYMFSNAAYSATTWSIVGLNSWDTSSVTNMSNMFYKLAPNANSFDLNVSNWNIKNVTNMSSMFKYTGYNKPTTYYLDLSNWNISSTTNINMNGMFSLAGSRAITFSIVGLNSWNTSGVTNMGEMFDDAGHNATTWSIGDLSGWNTSNVTTMYNMFYGAGYSATNWSIGNLSNWNTSNVTSMNSMFQNAGYNATTWNSIGTLKTYADNIGYIFYQCPNAKASLNIYNNPSYYGKAFESAATVEGSGITVNYKSTTTNIDNIIATKSDNSNVVKGSQLD